MTDIEKKFIFTVIGFLILIMIVVLSIKSSNKNKLEQQKASENNTQLEDYVTSFEKIGSDVKVNNNEDLAKTKTYNNVEMSNIKFTSQNGNSVLVADVKNIGEIKHEKEIITLSIIGSDDTEIATLDTILTDLEPGETKQLTVLATADIVNAKNFIIKEK
ncbi:unknown [Clostridium sp. CAG:567]|jgi:hypothetical protein|nr:unknown [Clostridium sp. CAG:567]